jgi:hypothetical protein
MGGGSQVTYGGHWKQYIDRDRFYSGWWWIPFIVEHELEMKAKF